MTETNKTKRLTDDELEAVAGGVTAASMDPTAFHNDMQGYVAGHSTGHMPQAGLPGVSSHTVVHGDPNTVPTMAASLTHAPAGNDSSHPTLTGSGLAPIKR